MIILLLQLALVLIYMMIMSAKRFISSSLNQPPLHSVQSNICKNVENILVHELSSLFLEPNSKGHHTSQKVMELYQNLKLRFY